MTSTQPTLKAFHGRPTLKTAMLRELAAHRKADQLVKGAYWSNGKGCAVGCTIDGISRALKVPQLEHGRHALYETYLGIPEVLARIEDGIFEALPNGDAQKWPEQFIRAIRPRADLSRVWIAFTYDLLTAPDGAVQKYGKTREDVYKAITTVADLYARWLNGTKPEEKEWASAAEAARAAQAVAWAAEAARAAEAQRQAKVLLKLLRAAA